MPSTSTSSNSTGSNNRLNTKDTSSTTITTVGNSNSRTYNANDYNIGGYFLGTDAAGTGTQLISNPSYSTSYPIFTNYSNDIVLSDKNGEKVVLESRRDNFLIVKKSNLAIVWNEEGGFWDIFQIEKFEENFTNYILKKVKEKLKEEAKVKNNDSTKIVSDTTDVSFVSNSITIAYPPLFSNNIINSMVDIDGNIYVDLKDKKVYKYSENKNSWSRKNLNKFNLKIYRKAKSGELKKRNNRTLITERAERKSEAAYIPNYSYKNKNSFFNGNIILGNENVNTWIINVNYNNNNRIYFQDGTSALLTTNNTTLNYGVYGTAANNTVTI